MLGGKSAIGTSYVIDLNSKDAKVLPRNSSQVPIASGHCVTITTGGGGGYGDPFDRDSELVLQDVINGFVSVSAAERDYGVMVNLRSRYIDVDATQRLRSEKKGRS